MKFVLLSIALCFSVMGLGARVWSVHEFGILPDTDAVITIRLQEALDEIAAQGGGILKFPAGRFVTGTLKLPSHTGLLLEDGAVVQGSVNPYDYNGYAPGDCRPMTGLIVADNAVNIDISGPGCIDGRGLELVLAIDSLHHLGIRPDSLYNFKRMRPSLRPKLLDFKNVDSLKVENVSLRSSAAWGLSLNKCSNVKISGIDFVNRAYWNNDGIDIADCQNVLVENSRIDAADDGIVLKSFDSADGNCNIEIRKCTIISSASAFKIGTESFGGFRNIRVNDLTVIDTFRSAVAIESVDGAVIDNVVVDGVDAKNTGNAIFIRLGHRRGECPGALRNIAIRNMRCDVPFGRPDAQYDLRGPDISTIHNPFPSSITGIPGHKIENVILENIDITFPGRGTKGMGYIADYRINSVPEGVGDYPEFHMFGELPAWAFYLRHIDGLVFKNVKVRCIERDYRHPVVEEDVSGVIGEIVVE